MNMYWFYFFNFLKILLNGASIFIENLKFKCFIVNDIGAFPNGLIKLCLGVVIIILMDLHFRIKYFSAKNDNFSFG